MIRRVVDITDKQTDALGAGHKVHIKQGGITYRFALEKYRRSKAKGSLQRNNSKQVSK